MIIGILGNGFDSLLAAHAASVLSHDVLIFSEEPKPENLVGPQILRAPIPMVPAAMAPVETKMFGDPDVFLDKLLNQGGRGKEPEGINPEIKSGTMLWDAQATYDWLWETYGRFTQKIEKGIGYNDVLAIKDGWKVEYLISGVDRDELCGKRNEHSFNAAMIACTDPGPVAMDEPNSLEFNGDTELAWAIESHLFGVNWRCYGAHKQPPISVHKLSGYIIPQGFHCDCHAPMSPTSMDLVGKLGAWDLRWERHDSFYKTFENLKNR